MYGHPYFKVCVWVTEYLSLSLVTSLCLIVKNVSVSLECLRARLCAHSGLVAHPENIAPDPANPSAPEPLHAATQSLNVSLSALWGLKEVQKQQLHTHVLCQCGFNNFLNQWKTYEGNFVNFSCLTCFNFSFSDQVSLIAVVVNLHFRNRILLLSGEGLFSRLRFIDAFLLLCIYVSNVFSRQCVHQKQVLVLGLMWKKDVFSETQFEYNSVHGKREISQI